MMSLLPEPEPLQIVLIREQRSRIKDLKGFRRTHSVPDQVNDHTAAFAARTAAEDLSEDLDVRFSDFRRAFRYRRTQLEIQEPDCGVAGIVTPDFQYQVSARIAEDDPSTVWFRRQLSGIRFSAESSVGLKQVFGTLFDTVEYSLPVPLDLVRFIDDFEELSPENAVLDYDRHLNWCRVSIPGQQGFMRFTAGVVSLSVTQPMAPDALLASFQALYSRSAMPAKTQSATLPARRRTRRANGSQAAE